MKNSRRSLRKPFAFKQFSVRDDHCGMRVGTDAVLLGAWADIHQDASILDVGTGCGIIALMLAQRTIPSARIAAVELAQHDCEQARENILASPWPDKVTVHHAAIQNFDPGYRFDHIVSNPPYFVNSLRPPAGHRRRVRHTDQLTFGDLLTAVDRLLSLHGKFSIILPVPEGEAFESLSNEFRMFIHRRWIVHSKPHKPAERLLMEFRRGEPAHPATGNLVLLDNNGERSADYQRLTSDFYLRSSPHLESGRTVGR